MVSAACMSIAVAGPAGSGAPIVPLVSSLAWLVAGVIGVPIALGGVGALLRPAHAFRYVFSSAVALIAVFALTGTTQFASHWTALGICAVLALLGGHLVRRRAERIDLVVLAGIYGVPTVLGLVLLHRTLT